MQTLIKEIGTEPFIFGPPPGVEKAKNAHRDFVAPKIASRMEFLAKKMREMYVRDAVYPDVKIFLDPLRIRQPDDTLQKLHSNQEVAACINARDEFPDLDLVFPNRTPFTIQKAEHGMVRPFYVRHND